MLRHPLISRFAIGYMPRLTIGSMGVWYWYPRYYSGLQFLNFPYYEHVYLSTLSILTPFIYSHIPHQDTPSLPPHNTFLIFTTVHLKYCQSIRAALQLIEYFFIKLLILVNNKDLIILITKFCNNKDLTPDRSLKYK